MPHAARSVAAVAIRLRANEERMEAIGTVQL
jgi:hypothetical protein